MVEGLGIGQMSVSDYALREGLVYDLLGRIANEDIRDHVVSFQRIFTIISFHMPLKKILYLYLWLRLAVLLHRRRSPQPLPPLRLAVINHGLKLCFPSRWIEQHPLTPTDLQQEYDYLQKIKLTLHFK